MTKADDLTIPWQASRAGSGLGSAIELRRRIVQWDFRATRKFLRFLGNAVLITALLPYVSPFVIANMDVQPTALVTSSCVLLALFVVVPRMLTPSRTDFCVFLVGLITLLYFDPGAPGGDLLTIIRACAPIILGFPVYLAVRILYKHMTPQVFAAVVTLYLGVVILQLTFTRAYTAIFSHVLSDMRFSLDDGRGPNALTTEPSMMGDMCLLFAVSLYFFHREYWIRHRNLAMAILAASTLMLILTRSGTGVALAAIVSIAALFTSKLSIRLKVLILPTLLALVPILAAISSMSNARSAVVLGSMAESPLSVVRDESFASRILGVFVGLYAIPNSPFGNGSIRQDVGMTNKALNSSVAIAVWPNDTLRGALVDVIAIRDNNSGIGGMIQRMGIFALVGTALLLHFVKGFHGKWVVRIFILGLLLNASMFIPTLWFIVGCSAAISKDEKTNVSGESPALA